MSAPGWYVDYLLGRAVEAAASQESGGLTFSSTGRMVYNGGVFPEPVGVAALTALLDDLGADYEPMPSGDEVREAVDQLSWRRPHGVKVQVTYLRDLYRTRPVLALAVLAGGEV